MSHLKAVPEPKPDEKTDNPEREEQPEEKEMTVHQDQQKNNKVNKWFKRNLKKLSRVKQGKKQKTKKPKVLRQTTDILPFVQIHDDHILMKNGVMDIFQIETKNINALNDIDLNYLLLNRARFLRSYFQSYKEVILNFPANTRTQRSYWLKKMEETSNPVHLRYIQQKLYEFDFLEKERSNREFFLFVYADDKEALDDRKEECTQGMKESFPLKELSRSKKEQILFLLNNQNTKL